MASRVTPSHPTAFSALRLVPAHDALLAIGGWAAPVLPTQARSRWLLGLTLFGAASLLATWFAIRHVPWFGPMVADNLRALVGGENVTFLEETVASVEDRVHSAVSDGRARSLSEATPTELLTSEAAPVVVAPSVVVPRDVGALYPQTQGADDGKWQPVRVRGSDTSALYRTIVHPDAERAYAELFVFALDLSKVSVHAVAGSIEPKNPDKDAPAVERPGLIPSADQPRLIAAFNGGFKAEHGQFGMMVDGSELLAPKPKSCTFAARADGSLSIAPWTALAKATDLSWWRQTPGCMVEQGVLHPGLRTADSTNWGATIEGKTVIRRSAVGLSEDGRTLLVGISNSTTARALALGMQHAGARNVAQLDVNFSFPRFLLYRDGEANQLNAVGAVRGLLYEKDEYLGRASTRDFFYVTLR